MLAFFRVLHLPLLLFSALILGPMDLCAQEPDPARVSPSGKYDTGDKPAVEAEKLKVEPLGAGKFRLGQIEIDAAKRQLTFPVALAETQNQLEYALVHSAGKTHESLLVTDVHPKHLHVAALLLFAKPRTQIEARVHWNINGSAQSIDLSKLIQVDTPDHKPITWSYQALANDKLAAATELSLLSLINDPASLIAHSLPATDLRDDIYRPQLPKNFPKKGLTLTLTFPKKK